MPKKLDSLTKTKISSKAAVLGVIAATVIGLSFILATILPQVGSGKFYGSTVAAPPPPLGCCDLGHGSLIYKPKSVCDGKPQSFWWPPDQSFPDPADGPIIEGAKCKTICPSDTVTCGKWCCAQGQTCVGDVYEYCTAVTCPPQAPKLCDNADRSTCCESTATCGITTIYKLFVPVGTIATCVPNTDCGAGTTSCGTIKKDDGTTIKFCCPAGTTCDQSQPVRYCKPNSCDAATQDMCVGGGVQICCPKGTCAYHTGGGMPFCNIKF